MNPRSQQKVSFLNPDLHDLKSSIIGMENRRSLLQKNYKTKKVLIMGLNHTGKSSIALKFLYDFPDASNHGPEENYYTSIRYKNENFLLHIVDIAGIDEYTPLYASKYSVKVDGYIYVYSIDNKESFEFVQLLRDKLYALNGKHMPSVLVANKCDLKDHRQVTTEEGKRLAKSFDIPFFEISAKKHSSEVIRKVFEVVLKDMAKNENNIEDFQCMKGWDEKRVEHLYDLFNFGTLLTTLIGLFMISFGVVNLLIYPEYLGNQSVFLVLMVLNGFLMMACSILGYTSMKKEEKDWIAIFGVIGIVSLLVNIGCIMLKIVMNISLKNDLGQQNGKSDVLINLDPIIDSIFIISVLLEVFLLVVSYFSKEIFLKRKNLVNSRFVNLKV